MLVVFLSQREEKFLGFAKALVMKDHVLALVDLALHRDTKLKGGRQRQTFIVVGVVSENLQAHGRVCRDHRP